MSGAYLDHPDCDVVALCDANLERAEGLAEEWRIPDVYDQVEDLLADEAIDAVEILTPTHLHHAHVLAALEAGKHVSVQKPIANTVEEGREMGQQPSKRGLVLRVSECYAHYPPLERARALIAEGAIGTPTNVRIRTVVGQTDSAFQAGLWGEGYVWRLNHQSPGGHLFDDMVHKYAMALWLVEQDIVSVQAVVRRRDLFFEPCAVHVRVRGAVAARARWRCPTPRRCGCARSTTAPTSSSRCRATRGSCGSPAAPARCSIWPRVMVYRGTRATRPWPATTTWTPTGARASRRSSAHFVDALSDGTTPDMTAGEAVKVLQLCFAVYQAGNTGAGSIPGP